MKMHIAQPNTCRPNGEAARPALNIRKADQSVELQFAVPGFRKDDLTVRVDGEDLVILGQPQPEDINGFVRREFRPFPFEKRFRLGERVAQDQILARVEDGILHITIGLTQPLHREIAVA